MGAMEIVKYEVSPYVVKMTSGRMRTVLVCIGGDKVVQSGESGRAGRQTAFGVGLRPELGR